MKDLKHFLARPTRVPLALLAISIVLMMTMLVLSVQHLHPAAGEHIPWVSVFIAVVCLLLLGVMASLRSFYWMYRQYPDTMHEISTARRTAVRQADSWAGRWLASQRNMPMPLLVVALGWFVVGLMASGVVLFAVGVLH